MAEDKWKISREKGYLKNNVLITSLPDLISCVDYLWQVWVDSDKESGMEGTESPWYRGVIKETYDLRPGIYRDNMEWKYNWEDALDIREEFTRRATAFRDDIRSYSQNELYHVMQHYRLPTRLLDWTESLPIALYFAIRECKTTKCEASPCIWMLNPWWLNERVTGHRWLFASHFVEGDKISRKHVPSYFREKRLPSLPLAVLPPHIDRRIVAQKSVFTVHGRGKDGLMSVCRRYKNAQLAQLRLDVKEFETLMDQTRTVGITDSAVFPDLEALTREILEEYEMTRKTA